MNPYHRAGLRQSLIAFFQDNPDEFLTVNDAREKWATTKQNVLDTACRMRKVGELGPGPELRPVQEKT